MSRPKMTVHQLEYNNIKYKLYVTDHSITCDAGFPYALFTKTDLLEFRTQKINKNDFGNFFSTNSLLNRFKLDDVKIYRISIKIREECDYKCENIPWAEVYEMNFQVEDYFFRFDSMASGSETEFGQSTVMKIEEINSAEKFNQYKQI